jgi:Arc/MetJ-type ribon-helix-helix transcriptional regulator
MGTMQVHRPDHIQSVIDRHIAEGRAASKADRIVEALRLYADHPEVEDEIAGMAKRAEADMAAVRYVTVATPEDSEALHQAAMARLRARLAAADGECVGGRRPPDRP